MIRLACLLALALAVVGGTSGCASNIAHWIVETRNRQGDVALDHGNYVEAQIAYKLALQVDPPNVHARTGLTGVQLEIAAQQFRKSRFDDALENLSLAAKYDPQNVRLAELRGEIEQAKLKREIVVSNYPAYRETSAQIRRDYASLTRENERILETLKRFNYTFDTAQLSAAIRASYGLEADIVKVTNRLITFRQLVESGAPDTAKSAESVLPPASLLPLP